MGEVSPPPQPFKRQVLFSSIEIHIWPIFYFHKKHYDHNFKEWKKGEKDMYCMFILIYPTLKRFFFFFFNFSIFKCMRNSPFSYKLGVSLWAFWSNAKLHSVTILFGTLILVYRPLLLLYWNEWEKYYNRNLRIKFITSEWFIWKYLLKDAEMLGRAQIWCANCVLEVLQPVQHQYFHWTWPVWTLYKLLPLLCYKPGLNCIYSSTMVG